MGRTSLFPERYLWHRENRAARGLNRNGKLRLD